MVKPWQDTTALYHALTAPRSVAIVGASGATSKLTSRPQRFLHQHGYKGHIYPVNPRHEQVLGVTAFSDPGAIDGPVDHAYVLLGTESVTGILEQCARLQVPVVSILADGFAEAGEMGQRRQRELVKIADDNGIFLLGPNSMGVVDTRSGFACTTNAAFVTEQLVAGRTAVISQSGSIIGTILSRGQARGLAFSTFVSVGNEAQQGVGEVGRILLEDPDVDSYLLFMETLRRADAVAEFARSAHARGRPVVAYLTSRSTAGQSLAVSHTGALIGNTRAAISFLEANGVVCVDNFEALMETPAALRQRQPDRPRTVMVVTTTGGGGAMVVDRLSRLGVTMAKPGDNTARKLQQLGFNVDDSPLLDVTLAGAQYDVMKAVLDILSRDSQIGIVLVAIGSSAQFNPELAVRPIVDLVTDSKGADRVERAPIMAFPLPEAHDSLRLLQDSGVPAFRTVESCTESLRCTLSYQSPVVTPGITLNETVLEVLDGERAAQLSQLSEVQSAVVFNKLGIRSPAQITIADPDDLPEQLPFDFPVVVKLVSATLAHKSDAGAVVLNISNNMELRDVCDRLYSLSQDANKPIQIEGLLIQQQHTGGTEMLIGLIRDPVTGPTVTVAMGGVQAELYADAACAPAPLTFEDAERLVIQLKGVALLQGYRGRAVADMNALVEAIVAVSTLALHPRIEEAEINPLVVNDDGEGCVALDALIRLT